MAETKRWRARIRQEYKRSTLVLLGGVAFSKQEWTDIPASKVEEALRDYQEYLEFAEAPSVVEGVEEESLEASKVQGNTEPVPPEPDDSWLKTETEPTEAEEEEEVEAPSTRRSPARSSRKKKDTEV